MSKIYSGIRLSWELFLRRALSVKVLTLLLLLGIMYNIFLSPVKHFCVAVGHPASPWVFPLLISDLNFLTFFASAIVYYFSDVPFMNDWATYQVIRTGRVKWAWGQIGSLILSSFAYVIITALVTGLILLPGITLGEGWGKVFYTLAMTNAGSEFNIPFAVSYGIISRLTPFGAMGIAIVTDGLVILFIGLLMFAVSLYVSRLWANALALGMAVFPIVVRNIGNTVPWLVNCSPVSWMRMTEISVSGETGTDGPLLAACVIALLAGCAVLSAVIIRKICRVDFVLTKED